MIDKTTIDKKWFTNSVSPHLDMTINEIEEQLSSLKKYNQLLQEISDYLNSYIQIRNVEVENMIITLTNRALNTIFEDRIEIDLVKKIVGNKIIYSLIILKDGVEGTVDSFGGGILAVIAVILKITFTIRTQSYPVLFLDESLGFVSKEYQPKLSQFLKTISNELGMTIVLISHQSQVIEYADNLIELSNGE